MELKFDLSLEIGIASTENFKLDNTSVKTQTKIIAEQQFIPFHIGGAFQLNSLCHIHESYSKLEFNSFKSKLK